MISNHDEIIAAIQSLNEVEVTFEKGDRSIVTRRCAIMDYAPSAITKTREYRYHFWDFEGTDGPHQFAPPIGRIRSVIVLNTFFNPADFVDWQTEWNVARDSWGEFN